MARIDARAGETGVLAKTTALEIVHTVGERLQAAARARAEAVYARLRGLRRFVPATSQGGGAQPGGLHDGADEAKAAATAALIGFPVVPRIPRGSRGMIPVRWTGR